MNKITQAFSRLSSREKVLVSIMGFVIFLAILFFFHSHFQNKIDTLQDNISYERKALRDIGRLAPGYLSASDAYEAIHKRAIANANLNVAKAVAEIAARISFEATDPRRGALGRRDLGTFLDFKPPKERPVTADRRSSSRNKEPMAGYIHQEQEITFKDNIPFETLYELFEKIEESDDLLFITELRMDRSRTDPERAGAGKIVVSSYYWQEAP